AVQQRDLLVEGHLLNDQAGAFVGREAGVHPGARGFGLLLAALRGQSKRSENKERGKEPGTVGQAVHGYLGKTILLLKTIVASWGESRALKGHGFTGCGKNS